MTGADMAAPTQTADGHDMDHYVADLAAADGVLTGPEERHPCSAIRPAEARSVHCVAGREGRGVFEGGDLSAVPPLMVKTA